MTAIYQPRRHSSSQWHDIRGLSCHVSCWGDPAGELLLLLHGWMDNGATFQFLADCLADRWYVVAPDWRGFGQSAWAPGGYWFPDYLADLDALGVIYSPAEPLNLVGHSMGGNVACLYAGVRPQRVRRLATLEGFGVRDTESGEAPARYLEWLEQQGAEAGFTLQDSYDSVALRLQEKHPHLSEDRAGFVARAWMNEESSGKLLPRADPAHKRVNPVLYRSAEAEACWRAIAAPVLWVSGADSQVARYVEGQSVLDDRQGCFEHLSVATIPDAGHMLHHDQPEHLARILEAFFA